MAEGSATLLARDSRLGRRTLTAVTLGSGIALLDGTVVNIALRRIGEDLNASLIELQWVVNGYMLTLAALILVGGSLGDRLGRRRMYLLGIAGFALASGLCAAAQSPVQLVGFRMVQGLSAALLVPGGLALIQSTFRREDRAAAIGTWAGFSGIAAAVGPLLGGFLVEHGGWRWIFAINIPLCVLVLALGLAIPESKEGPVAGEQSGERPRRFDVAGAAAGVVMLGGSTYALTSWRELAALPLTLLVLASVGAIVLFAVLERRPGAMMPVALFTSRVFTAANLMTFLVYGALGALLFFLVIQLQVTGGYSPLAAGLSPLPLTLSMLLLSSRFSRLSAVSGPRLLMTVGPIMCAVGVLLLSGIDGEVVYLRDVALGMVLFALGLAALVAPLTTAVLAAAPDEHAGVASGVNNAVARAGSLLAVAALPAAVGLAGADYQDPVALTHGYRLAMLTCASLLAAGGVVSWFGMRGTDPVPMQREDP
ncbi:MAG: MFS transporter [Marmoricola sp.]